MRTPGPLEIIIVLVIVLLVFGPKRLPDLGRSLGKGMREFKDSVTGKDKEELPEVQHVDPRPRPRACRPTTTTSRRAEALEARVPRREGRRPRVRPIAHEDRLSIVEHLDELRSRLIFSIIAFVVAWAICGWQNHLVLEILNAPLPDGIEPITLGPAEPFYTTLTNSAYAAILLVAAGDPVPALRVHPAGVQPARARVALPLLLMVPVLFIAGVVFCYFVVLHAGDALPAQLQRRRVQHRGPGARLLLVRHDAAAGDGHRLPDPDRDPRRLSDRARHAAAAAQERAATRSS